MNIDIKFHYENDNDFNILEKVKQQIGDQLDDLVCSKHKLPPNIWIMNIQAAQKDIIDFQIRCCCKDFGEIIKNKLESISNGYIFKVSSVAF